MPTIPTYQRQVSAITALPDARPIASNTGALIKDAAQTLAAWGEQREEARRVTMLNHARTQWAVRRAELVDAASRSDWREAEKNFSAEASKAFAQISGQMDDMRAREEFAMDYERTFAPALIDVRRIAFDKESDFNLANLMETRSSLASQRALAGSPAERASIDLMMQSAIEDSVKAGWIDPLKAGQLSRDYRNEGDKVEAMSLIRANPYEARRLLEKGSFANLEPLQVQSLLNSADGEIRSREAEARARQAEARRDYADGFERYLTRLQFTGEMDVGAEENFSPERLTAVLGEEGGKQASELLTSVKRQAVNRTIISTASPDELGTILQQSAERVKTATDPKIAAQEYKDLLGLIRERESALNSDPAGYVSRSPAMREPLQAYQEAVASKDQGAITAATERLVKASLAEQGRLGVPGWAQKPLSEQMAKSLAGELGAAPPEQYASTIQSVASQYGSYWPQVVGQMGNKIEPGALALILTDQDPQTSALLAEAMKAGRETLRRNVDDLSEVTRQIAGNSLLEQFRRSVAFQVGGIETAQSVMDSVELMTLARIKVYGESPSTAAEKAATSILGSVTFEEANAHPFRVPRAYAQDAPLIGDGASSILERFDATGIDLPAAPEGSPPDEVQRLYAAAVRRSGVFFTEPNNRGLFMWDGNAIVTKNGQPLLLTWDELKRAASAAPVGPARSKEELNRLERSRGLRDR